jgi:membrane protease subunit (stomatin/prohibitin family)
MGLFGDLQRQFIARPDASKGQIVFKWPDADIRKFTQLTVEADEIAVFFRDGRVAGTFVPGRYTLDSSLFPFLADLIDRASGGNMFKTEVYFVGTHEFPNLPFGGTVDNVIDAETQLAVGLRVFGDYSLKVLDASALIVNLVGSQNLATNDAITNWMRDMVLKTLRTDVVKNIVANGWPILGIAAHTDDIERDTLSGVQANVVSYGVQIARMGNFTISLSDADDAALKNFRRDVSYSKLAGGFVQYGAGAALRGIGEGAAKGEGGAASGSLLGFGVGLGSIVAGAATGNVAGSPSAPAASPVAAGAATPEAGAAHFCTNCGAALAQGAKFCGACGTKA